VGDDFFLDPNPLLDDALVMRLTYDMAAGIHEPAEIAVRYGFPDKAGLRTYLKNHPGVIANIRKAKALMESEEGSETRARLKAMQATEGLIASTASMAIDPRIPPQQRIDAFKQLSRVGGLDGSAAAQAAKGAGGPAFTLNILFRNNPAEKLNIIDNGPVGAPAKLTTVVNNDLDEFEEDV
jgi:hypothetical protein